MYYTRTVKGGGGGESTRVLYAYCQSYYGFQSGQLTKHGTTGHHSVLYCTVMCCIVLKSVVYVYELPYYVNMKILSRFYQDSTVYNILYL